MVGSALLARWKDRVGSDTSLDETWCDAVSSTSNVSWRSRVDSPVFDTRILGVMRTSSRDNACLNILIISFEPTKGSVGL
jgi:hypothetical protein